MISDKQIDFELLTSSSSTEIMDQIKSKVDPSRMIPPSWSNLQMMGSGMINMVSSAHGLVIYLDIPLVKTSLDYQCWRLSAVPIPINPALVLFQGNDARVIMDKTNSRWALVDTSMWDKCRRSLGAACPIPLAWRTDISTSCLPSLTLTVKGDYMNLCKMRMILDVGELIYDIPITNTQWLISIIGNGLPLTQSCKRDNQMGFSETNTISGVNLLTVEEGCTFQIGSRSFTPASLIDARYQVARIDIPEMLKVDYSVNQVGVIHDLSSDIPINSNKKMTKALADSGNETVFIDGLATMAKIIESRKNTSDLKYLTKEDWDIAGAFDKQKVHQILDSVLTESWSWSTWAIIIGVVLVVLWLAVKCLKAVASNKKMVLPITMSSLLHPVESAISKFQIASVNSTKASNISLNTLGQSDDKSFEHTLAKAIGAVMEELAAITLSSPHNQWIWHTAGMVLMCLTMIICHYLARKSLNRIMRSVLLSLGVYPKNLLVQHHVGESSVLITFLVHFYGFWKGLLSLGTLTNGF